MSYILDALRKSEAERATTKTPTPTTIHEADRAPAGQRWLWWLVPLNVALVGLVLWLVPAQRPVPESSPAGPAPQPSGLSTQSAPQPSRLSTQPAPKTRPQPARPATPLPQITEQDLAEPLRGRIARLTFSTHIYADDAAMRAVSIDGQRLREGQSTAQGYRVAEITPEGVVLEIEGQRVAIDVLARWRL